LSSVNFAGALTYVITYLVAVTKPVTDCRRIEITHPFMPEAEYCDRIGLVYRGKIIAAGTPDDLKHQVASSENPNPSMEQAFIELVQGYDQEEKA